jgi:diacylglycerol kinase (ATP)
MDPLRAAVVYNPIKVDLPHLRAAIDAAASSAGWAETLWFASSAEDGGRQAAQNALRAGVNTVIAAGGDGTVRAVAAVLRNTPLSLAIVPSGTGNLLARNLKMPLGSLAESAAIAFGGKDKAIDLGLVTVTDDGGVNTEHVFLVMAGLGFDAEMIARTRPELKKQVGWLAYVDAGVRILPSTKPFRMRYSLGSQAEHQVEVSSILIANCGLLPGNIQLLPEARLDDGVLDVAVLQPKGVLGWLQIWRRVTWENTVLRRSAAGRRIIAATESAHTRTMTTLRTTDIRIVPDHPQEFEIDGEPMGPVRSVFFRAAPGALLVRV